jgi:hypothetical protein
MLMDSRSEDNVAGFFLKWFMTFLLNFTIGLVTSLITFVFMVYNVVFSYSPDPLSGTRPATTHTSRSGLRTSIWGTPLLWAGPQERDRF